MIELLLVVLLIGIVATAFPIAEPYRRLVYIIVVVLVVLALFQLITGQGILPLHFYRVN